MGSTERVEAARSAVITYGHVLSRRDFLRVAGLAGLGVAGAHMVLGSGNQVGAAAGSARGDPISDLAAALDFDAERIFRFVADEIRYDPYAGILRGARGTLASRAGNSADQALLLAALLDASLLPVRFAVGEIDTSTADTLMASMDAEVESIRRHDLTALAGTLPGTDPAPLELTSDQQKKLDDALANGDRVVSWARKQLERTVGTITSALEDAGVELLDGFTPMPDSERSRHVWVQVAATADWVDLDPTMPGATPGGASTAAAEILDALPEDMAHLVELAVIGETLTTEGLAEQRLVGVSDRADRLAGLPIMIANTAPDALTGLGVSVAGALGGGDSYVPVIIVGEDAVVSAHAVSLPRGPSGASEPSRSSTVAAPTDAFLSPTGEGPQSTAEWVELTIRSPEVKPVTIRRAIFDRLGPARRVQGEIRVADLEPVTRIDLPDGSTGQATAALTSHWFTVGTGLPGRNDPVSSLLPDDDPADLAIMSQAYGLTGVAAGLDVAVPAGFRPFLDAPNVTAYSLVARPMSDGRYAIESGLDIWHRSHGVVPVADVSLGLPPMLASGVLAHVAERIQGGEAIAADPSTDPGSASVGALLDASTTEGIGWRVVQGPGASADLPWGDDSRARLEAALADGWVAVVPDRPVRVGGQDRVGWWLVDRATGRARDESDDGRGQSTSDETVIISRVSMRNLAAQRRFGLCLAGISVAVASGVGLYFAQAAWAAGDLLEGGGLGGAASEGFILAVALMLQGEKQGAGSC